MKPIYPILFLVVAMAALQGRAPLEARLPLVPVSEERKEPTLAPPEPAQGHGPGQIVVVGVEGEVDVEQALENGLPADDGGPDLPDVTVP